MQVTATRLMVIGETVDGRDHGRLHGFDGHEVGGDRLDNGSDGRTSATTSRRRSSKQSGVVEKVVAVVKYLADSTAVSTATMMRDALLS